MLNWFTNQSGGVRPARLEPVLTEGPLRVLHVLPAMNGGGMETAMTRLVRAWHEVDHGCSYARGIEHGLCTLREGDDDMLDRLPDDVPRWCLGHGDADGGGRDLWAWWRLWRVIREYRPDIVHARSTGLWLDACLATMPVRGVRLMLGFHGRESTEPLSSQRVRLHRWCAARADAVVAVSHKAAEMMHAEWGIGRKKLRIVRNGVDTEQFRPLLDDHEKKKLRARFKLNLNHHVVICVANLLPIKGLDVLLTAWRQVVQADRQARLLVVGDGPLHDELETMARQLRCQQTLRLLGRRDDIPSLLRMSDLFVLPSRYEGCSNAIVEAMASGLAIVATDVGGTGELVHSNLTGWLVPPNDAGRLAETIAIALTERTARLRVGASARGTALRRMSLPEWVGRYAACCREVAAGVAARWTPHPMEESACAG